MASSTQTPYITHQYRELEGYLTPVPLHEAATVAALQAIHNLHDAGNACVHIIHTISARQAREQETGFHADNGDVPPLFLPFTRKSDCDLVRGGFCGSVGHACAERISFTMCFG